MSAKNFNLEDFLINNGIIIVLIMLAVVTGILQPTFFTPKTLSILPLTWRRVLLLPAAFQGV